MLVALLAFASPTLAQDADDEAEHAAQAGDATEAEGAVGDDEEERPSNSEAGA